MRVKQKSRPRAGNSNRSKTSKLADLPDKIKYGVVYLEVGSLVLTGDPTARYHTILAWDQIRALPITTISSENTILLLACSHQDLVQSLATLTSWNFVLNQVIPWLEIPTVRHGFPPSVVDSRFLLVARNGVSAPLTPVGAIVSSAPWAEQEASYDYAERLPGPHLELCPLKRRAGWDSWGSRRLGIPDDLDLLADLPKAFLKKTLVSQAAATIRSAWTSHEENKWAIGDAIAHLVYHGVRPMSAYRIAMSQMNRIDTIYWPRLMYKIAITFPARERNPKKSWHDYRKEYLAIRKVLAATNLATQQERKEARQQRHVDRRSQRQARRVPAPNHPEPSQWPLP